MFEHFSWPSSTPDRCDLSIAPLLAGVAVRDIANRSKGSEIGDLVCPTTKVVIPTESGIEHSAALVAYSDDRIRKVRSQAHKIALGDHQGPKTHTLDLRADRDDGYAYGLVGKPHDKAVRHDLRALIDRLNGVANKPVDQFLPVDERDMPEWLVRNAGLFFSVRSDRRTSVDDQLREIIPELVEPLQISDLTRRLGGGTFAFRPVARAIFYGSLVVLQDGLIDPSSWVRFSGCLHSHDEPIVQSEPGAIELVKRRRAPRKSKPKRRFSYRED